MTNPFSNDAILCGELRHPRQMLDDQTYDGHQSIHDDSIAEDLGFTGAPIEGPTHFSQFVPLLYEIFGQAWFETGCISAHYQTWLLKAKRYVRLQNVLSAAQRSRRFGRKNGMERR